MSKYYGIEIERDGTLEGAANEVMKGLHGKLHNEHKERSRAEFWRCQRQMAMAVLARIEAEQVRLGNDPAACFEDAAGASPDWAKDVDLPSTPHDEPNNVLTVSGGREKTNDN